MPIAALVRVVGFSPVERHALNSLLRVSQQRSPSYMLWTLETDRSPSIILVDANDPESDAFVHRHRRDPLTKVLWVGGEPHIFSWRNYERPISWVRVLRGMDDAFAITHIPPADSDYVQSDYGLSEPALYDSIKSIGPGVRTVNPIPPKRKRVLVVDDDRMARLYLKAKLSLVEPPVEVDEASTGDEAIQMVRIFAYDGVLLDVNMPGIDGYTVCRTIKRPLANVQPSSSGRIPKVVMITSRDGMVDRVRGTLAGADAYIAKPPHPAKLKDLISSL